MKSRIPAGSAGLYVHIPFCVTKCPYCDFFSVTDLSLVDDFLEALAREASLYAGRFKSFDTLYIGGGTPSVLSPGQMSRLFSSLRSCFRFDPSCEITVEINPDDATRERFRTLAAEGVNRLSIGVQSFRDKDLAFLKRRHNAATARRAIEGALDAGFEDLSIDLMYPLPGQTKRSWPALLEQALAYPISHLSCYQLTIEERTPFGRMRGEGNLKTAGEGRESELFLLTSQFLEERGFVHYEISNYARATQASDSFSRHNTKYWTRAPYLGLGPAAHSFDGRSARWWNVRSVREYCKTLKEGRYPRAGREDLTAEQLHLERLYLGFRTKIGVSRCDIEDSENSGQTLQDLVDAGILEIVEDRVAPTRKGYLIADHLPLLFA
ncbi:MAG TPA: coproporphyrinogen III oxidase [Deltaproteobacteria bacterium]|nr:coproporphyrinogen III oxidase [Deltaproteobacteria bacterium]